MRRMEATKTRATTKKFVVSINERKDFLKERHRLFHCHSCVAVFVICDKKIY